MVACERLYRPRSCEESLRHVRSEYRMLPDDIGDWYVRAADGQWCRSRRSPLLVGSTVRRVWKLQRPAIYGNLRPGGTG